MLKVEPWQGGGEAWDRFVKQQAGWTPFHLHAWRDIIARCFGHECPYLVARDAHGIAGLLPQVLVRSPIFGRFLVSMPYVNYGGPLGSPDAVSALAEEATRLGRAARVKLTEFRSREELPILLPASHRKITVVLDIPPLDAPGLFKRFDSKLRSQVRRPQKEGIVVRWGHHQLDAFYSVFAEHMRDLGTPVLPRRFFAQVLRAFGEDAWLGVAWKGDIPIAGGLGFRWDAEFEMTWASALYAYNKLSPNMLLYWAFMERACAEGLTLFNFGRCSPGAGTHRFKSQWGSRDEQLWWYQDSRAGVSTPSPDDGAYALGPREWKKLPLPVANAMGPWIVKGIP